MIHLSSKNDGSSLCYDVIITHQKNLKLTNLMIFRVISIITVRQTYLKMLFPLLLINVSPDAQRAPLADTKCPPAAKCGCIYDNSYTTTGNMTKFLMVFQFKNESLHCLLLCSQCSISTNIYGYHIHISSVTDIY